MVESVLGGMLAALAYGAVGTVLMALGYVLVDLATPGRLRDLIWVHRNRNAAMLLCSGLLGVGLIAATAILVSEDGLVAGLLSSFGYGVAGLLLMAVSFVLLDLATPGKLGELLVDPEVHPAAWVSASVHLAISGIIAAAIS
ncbi:MAG: DUF350 domain-containing protein [Micromonosporaceae bacterium]